MAKRSYHEVLGVPSGATEADIKKAFRAAAVKLHPDKNPGDPNATRNFQELNEAYQALTSKKGPGRGRANSSEQDPGHAARERARQQQQRAENERRANEARRKAEEKERTRAEEQRKAEEKAKRDAKRRARAEDDRPIARERRAEARADINRARSERAARLKREAEQRADAAYEAKLKAEWTRNSWSAAVADRLAREVREEPRRARIVLMHIPAPFLASDNAATLRPILSRLEPDIFEARRMAFHVDGFNRAIPGFGNKHSAFLKIGRAHV
jgi:curved DNA-binding protein CbpA